MSEALTTPPLVDSTMTEGSKMSFEKELLQLVRDSHNDFRKDFREGLDEVRRSVDANTNALTRLADSAPPRAMVYGFAAVLAVGVFALLAFTIALLGDLRGANVEAAGRAAHEVTTPVQQSLPSLLE